MMKTKNSAPAPKFASRFKEDPILSDFTRPFPNLMGASGKDVGASFKRISQALNKSKRTAAIQFTLRKGNKTRCWCVTMTPNGSQVSSKATENPDLEIITDDASWSDIASGKLSLLEVFGQGRLRVRGDIQLAQLLARRIKRG